MAIYIANGDSATVWSSWNTGSTGEIWVAWNDDSCTTATNSSITTTGNCTISADEAWTYWTAAGTWTPDVRSPEQIAADRQAAEARAKERAEKAAEAKKRALALLRDVLDERQRQELEQHRYFTVHSRGSQRRYRVLADKGKHGNIIELDEEGREVASLCAAPVGNIPEGDYLAGQKLWLEHDEEGFRRTANFTRRRAG